MKTKLFSKSGYINLYSKNNKALIKFYKNRIGLPVINGSSEKWFGFDTRNVTFAIEPLSNRKNYKFNYNKKNPVLIQFAASSKKELEAMNNHLEKNGIKLLRKSEKRSYGTITNFLDPDGNVLEILLPKK